MIHILQNDYGSDDDAVGEIHEVRGQSVNNLEHYNNGTEMF